MELKKTNINNRRYLGNKYRLLPFISDTIKKECGTIDSFADIFGGTGAVSSAFMENQIIINDLLYSNHQCHIAWFSPTYYSENFLKEKILEYNNIQNIDTNYMTENFSNTFFSHSDCYKIGFIRQDIENLYQKQQINKKEKALLITSLLYAMDSIANTCGHYDAYRRNVCFDKSLQLKLPTPNNRLNFKNEIHNLDANILVKNINFDVVYLDPPYNSRQYSDAYHLLDNVAQWKKPSVQGVAKKMNRMAIKSKYNTQHATKTFADLIKNINARTIVLSYNNMATKGNDRSNAKISDAKIIEILENKGKLSIYTQPYKAFTTGKSQHTDNQERLFVCHCS